MSKRKTVPVHQLLGFSHGLIFEADVVDLTSSDASFSGFSETITDGTYGTLGPGLGRPKGRAKEKKFFVGKERKSFGKDLSQKFFFLFPRFLPSLLRPVLSEKICLLEFALKGSILSCFRLEYLDTYFCSSRHSQS